MNFTNNILLIIITIISFNVSAQNLAHLPTWHSCQGSSVSRWNACFGSWTNPSNEKYDGEWRDGKPNGQGIHTISTGDRYIGSWRDGRYHGQGTLYAANGSVISQGIWADNQLVRATTVNNNQLSDAQKVEVERLAKQLQEERQRLAEDRARLDSDKVQREQAKQSSLLSLQATATSPDKNGDFLIKIQTNADTSSLKINGEEIGGRADGSYSVKRFARAGQETKLTIVARDAYGTADTKIISVNRPLEEFMESVLALNVANIKVQPVRDAVAIIIGIQDYKRVPKAEFANEDARAFYDYARRGLGVKPENIKMLLDSDADDVEIVKAFSNWLPVKVNKDKTEVYVFYSGHGLPSEDGKLYFLPYGVDKDLLARTAVGQKEIVAALSAAKPKSVTMFIDSCYSGQIRGGETLLASARPINIKVDQSAYPDNFTVLSASSFSQISSSSTDLKHGIFSYFLMKGLEGDADLNSDGRITVGEMHSYLIDKVPRYAMKMNRAQDPQVQGDAGRILFAR